MVLEAVQRSLSLELGTWRIEDKEGKGAARKRREGKYLTFLA